MSLSAPGAVRLSTGARRFCLSSVLAAACWLPQLGHTQPADVLGIRYEPQVRVEGHELNLNGTGVAYRALVKLYTVGLYVPTKVHAAPEVLRQKGPKQLRFVMLRGMRVDELGKLITHGIEQNCTRQEFFSMIPAIRAMGEQFSHMQRLNAQDVFTIAYTPERGTAFFVNDAPVGPAIQDPQFFSAILKVWLGEHPTTNDLKNALLDHKAQPVLSALE